MRRFADPWVGLLQIEVARKGRESVRELGTVGILLIVLLSGSAALGLDLVFADGFDSGGTGNWSKVEGSVEYWPNSISFSNSDDWIADNHDRIRGMRPLVLVLVFMNDWHNEVDKTQDLIEALQLSTTFHGYDDPPPPAFLNYEVVKYVDLRDPPGTSTVDGNSTKYPRVPNWVSGNNFAYEELYSEEFAEDFGFEHPDISGRYLTLEELVDAGIIHEVWFFAYHGAYGAPFETIEIKQYYDEDFEKRPGVYGGAGNGHYPALPWTGRSLRFTFINGQRGIGCAMENFGHALEGMAHYNFCPYWRDHFYEYAGFDLDSRWGLPVNSFYAGGDGFNDYPQPDQLDWDWLGQSGTVLDYFAVGGNVHFMPSGRDHYDLTNTQTVYSTIEHYRQFDGPGNEDLQELWDRSKFTDYYSVAPDCMGPWLVYWRMNMPGLDNGATDMNQEAMKNWWPFLFY